MFDIYFFLRAQIIIKYLSTSGADANDAETYEPVSTVTIDAKTFSITVSSPTKSAGGSDKESLSSIKKNAPIKFASQQRLVTAQDYKALILSNFGSVSSLFIALKADFHFP